MFKMKKMTFLSFFMLVATVLLGNRAANFVISFLSTGGIVYVTQAAAPPKEEKTESPEDLVESGVAVEQTSYASGSTTDENAQSKDSKVGSATTVEVNGLNAKPLRTLDALEGGVSAEELVTLQQLTKRRQALMQREEKMKQRASVLAAVEQRMQDKLAELKKMHADFQKVKEQVDRTLKAMDDKENKRIEKLASIYSSMPPKKAAVIFNKLDLSIILQLLPRLKVAVSNQILSFMEPDKASLVTTRLAQKQERPRMKTALG